MQTTGNTILITGGGSGIGRGLAEALHKLGNTVIIAGRRRHVLEETVEANPGMQAIIMDTTDPQSIADAVADVVGKFPGLNVVINNAGVQRLHDFSADEPFKDSAALEEIDTNITGVLRVTAAVLPTLKSQPSATLINVSSGLAFVPLARFPIYCATKAFVHSFTTSLRHQLRDSNVKVVELAPPWVKTDLDATHGPRTWNIGMEPMPLDAFVAAAMAELATEGDLLAVAGAKYLYNGGIAATAGEVFSQINQ
jgi:uncharacterized oxidoreductase